ncbi:MAG TPA: hypothetical protein VG253_00150 [Streptosporangiaceae bacterium]|jgi:hypothetical protein|nr:hypothetical protein [Streptosporangiaceae bacterium]
MASWNADSFEQARQLLVQLGADLGDGGLTEAGEDLSGQATATSQEDPVNTRA